MFSRHIHTHWHCLRAPSLASMLVACLLLVGCGVQTTAQSYVGVQPRSGARLIRLGTVNLPPCDCNAHFAGSVLLSNSGPQDANNITVKLENVILIDHLTLTASSPLPSKEDFLETHTLPKNGSVFLKFSGDVEDVTEATLPISFDLVVRQNGAFVDSRHIKINQLPKIGLVANHQTAGKIDVQAKENGQFTFQIQAFCLSSKPVTSMRIVPTALVTNVRDITIKPEFIGCPGRGLETIVVTGVLSSVKVGSLPLQLLNIFGNVPMCKLTATIKPSIGK